MCSGSMNLLLVDPGMFPDSFSVQVSQQPTQGKAGTIILRSNIFETPYTAYFSTLKQFIYPWVENRFMVTPLL